MQQILSKNGFEKFGKKTRKERFLEEMETLIPWQEFLFLLHLVAHKAYNPPIFSQCRHRALEH